MSFIIEKCYPFITGVIAGLAYFLLKDHLNIFGSIKELLGAVINICAIAVGFLATTKSIMLSLGQNRIIQQLKNTDKYYTLIQYIMSAINLSFLTALLSAGLLFIDFSKVQQYTPYIFPPWIFITIWTVMACYRITRIFFKILMSKV